MLKALAATAAITVCCLGNDYPAKADALDAYAKAFVEMGERAKQERQLRQIIREEINAQQWGQE